MVTSDEIKDKILDIVAEQVDRPKDSMTMEMAFINDLGADSLTVIEMNMAIEDEFDIRIPDEEAENVKTVGAAIDYVTKAVAKKAAEVK